MEARGLPGGRGSETKARCGGDRPLFTRLLGSCCRHFLGFSQNFLPAFFRNAAKQHHVQVGSASGVTHVSPLPEPPGTPRCTVNRTQLSNQEAPIGTARRFPVHEAGGSHPAGGEELWGAVQEEGVRGKQRRVEKADGAGADCSGRVAQRVLAGRGLTLTGQGPSPGLLGLVARRACKGDSVGGLVPVSQNGARRCPAETGGLVCRK